MLCKSLTVTHRFLVVLIPSSCRSSFPSDLIFSNSLIIRQVKTKNITTVKEVWIPGLNKHRFDDFTSPFTHQFLFQLRRYIKHLIQCFIRYPNTSIVVKNTLLYIVFSTLFSVFGYPDETLSLMFDMLLRHLLEYHGRTAELASYSSSGGQAQSAIIVKTSFMALFCLPAALLPQGCCLRQFWAPNFKS